jgi:beta-glucosidase
MDMDNLVNDMTLEEKASICSGLDFWHTKAIERLNVPAVMMCDGPHGLRKQKGDADHLGINESIKTVSYPTASALAASFDRNTLHRLGEALGEECQAEDVAMLLGPGLNIKRSPLCGRNFEYFSEDPYLTGELAASYIQSLQDNGVAACVKHYAVNNQETMRMSGDSILDERTLHEIYLPAFEAAVKKGRTRSVMCAYNAVNGTFCAENKMLLTDILRNKWGFDGFVVTDWGAIQNRANCIKAGLDLEMPGGSPIAANEIIGAVQNGSLDESTLDNAVRNILRFVNESVNLRKPGAKSNITQNMKLAAELEQECAVLMKNENNILPLKKTAKVAFIGEFAKKPRYQGAGSSHINVAYLTGALEAADGLNVTYAQGFHAKPVDNDTMLLDEAVKTAKQADYAVIFAGLTNQYETEGVDRKTMDMPENQNKLIEAVAAVQSNTIVVLHTGSPVVIPWLDKVSAVLCVYLGGANVGTATVSLLYGDACPSGKLAETWPRKLADAPAYFNFPGEEGVTEYREGVYVGYRYYDKKQMDVLFPFGFGLSYTRFTYSDLKLTSKKINDGSQLTVSCKVKNIGAVAGKEAVQLYVCNPQNGVGRPIRELRSFEKINLEPGEVKEVSFTLDKRAFAYYEVKIKDWYAPSGEYVIEVGASSRDIKLSAAVQLEASSELPFAFSRNTPVMYLSKTAKGRALMQQMMAARGQEQSNVTNSLGEGSEEMVLAMTREMPLKAIAGFTGMPMEQLDGMIAELNS